MKHEIKQLHIDFLSIDVERNEVEVLKGCSLDKWKPSVIAIENLYGYDRGGVPDPEQFKILNKYGYSRTHRIVYNDIYTLR
jgi:hypothetical protein